MNLDGRIITIPQIGPHLASLQFTSAFQPKFPVLHNTSVPDMATYQKWVAAGRPTVAQWLQNLAAYYRSLGWNSMPHAFVLPDGTIGLGAPFNVRGTHTPSWNSISIGVETLGEFERDPWAGTLTEKASVALFGELCKRFHWQPDQYVRGVRGIHFHKEDPNTTHRTCPGKHVEKAKFVQQVLAYMGDSTAATETDRNGHLDVPIHAQEGVHPAAATVASAPMGGAPPVVVPAPKPVPAVTVAVKPSAVPFPHTMIPRPVPHPVPAHPAPQRSADAAFDAAARAVDPNRKA